MNPAKKLTRPVSNPMAVMRILETSDPEQGLTTLMPSQEPPSGVNLKLHVDGEQETSSDDSFWLDEPPSQQSQQLVDHLRNRQKDLVQREADLQAHTYQLETRILASEASFRKRNAELDQHLSQVHCQQEQLMKLQQNLVNSQAAIRKIVEQLVDGCDAEEAKQHLTALKDELGQQFDSNLQRWERLVSALNT